MRPESGAPRRFHRCVQGIGQQDRGLVYDEGVVEGNEEEGGGYTLSLESNVEEQMPVIGPESRLLSAACAITSILVDTQSFHQHIRQTD